MKVTETTQASTTGKRFKVNLETINSNLFLEAREDSKQEKIRQIILEAFAVAKNNPKYARPFTTIIPEKDWSAKYVYELEMLCIKFNGHNADWIEQSLEWAQKISNGTSWQELCNDADTCDWYRLVSWKHRYIRLVGGSKNQNSCSAATDVIGFYFKPNDTLSDAVPLIVVYD